MSFIADKRRRAGWLVHCFKALTRNYHRQLVPLFDILLKTDDLVIDVGAHAGQFTKIFARRVNLGMVLAVEPGSYPFSILEIVKVLHRLHVVKLLKMGVGVQPSEATLHTPVKENNVVRFGLSHIRQENDGAAGNSMLTETISVTTIDRLTMQFARDYRLALIKADIEGYEYEMLCGAEQAIDANRPALLMEVSINRQEILDFLWQRGYLVFALLNYSGKSTETLKLAQLQKDSENRSRNILAVHESRKKMLHQIIDSYG